MKTVKVRAPTRIDLAGGWTDVPPYSEQEGGFVCNLAIDRYATATLTEHGSGTSTREASEANTPLMSAAFRRAGLTDVHGKLSNDFPVGAGLGGSSAASAALLGAFAAWQGESWNAGEIAEAGRQIEVEDLGVPGGRQDHYAATHGGALALRFSNTVEVRRIALSEATKREFERRSFLVYTGESRISGGNISEVLSAYHAREPRVVISLARMRSIAEEMSTCLEDGDLDSVGSLVGEHWRHQRALHHAIPTPIIDEIVSRAYANGALGSKAMGASGGGCVYVMAAEDSVERVRNAIAPLGTMIPFRLDSEGLAICD